MKKLIGFIVVLVILGTGSGLAYHYFYGGTDYYTQIVTEGTRTEGNFDNGESYTQFDYDQMAYTKDGEGKEIHMSEVRDEPLRTNAYLKVKVNPRKGVLSWSEVKKNDVPDKALTKLTE